MATRSVETLRGTRTGTLLLTCVASQGTATHAYFGSEALLRGPELKIPTVVAGTESYEVTRERLETWAWAGWVDLREANMARWKDRFARIQAEMDAIPPQDTSSRFLRDRQFWGEGGVIQPGKVVGWIFATEEQGARMK